MGLRKCCVGNCQSTNRTHRLFYFPKKDDNLRKLWLSFVVPTNITLCGLSNEQLSDKCVCQNHFDRHQFDNVGNRLPQGYPCLMSEKEVLFGIPMCNSDWNHMMDHNYCLNSNDEDMTSVQTASVTTHEGEHSYSIPATEDLSEILEPMDICHNITIPSTDVTFIGETSSASKATSQKENSDTMYSNSMSTSKITKPVLKTAKKRAPKLTRFVHSMTKLAKNENKKENAHQPFSEKISKAKSLIESPLFRKNFSKMTKQAQNFLLMQLKVVGKKKKGVRFNTEEKLLSLSLMKESPKGYRFLQKIFRLPTKRTLNRLAEDIIFKTGLNDNVFKLLQQNTKKWETIKKLCSIVFDEVALTPHVTYVESHDEVQGYKDLGYERQMKYADHALVFMIRGVCSTWRQPIAYYFCEKTIAAASLIRILKQIVTKLSQSGMIPVAVICDQGSTFRSAINTLRKDTEHKRNLNGEHDDGTIEISNLQLSVVFDPPHLLKGIRNNFLSKDMIFNGKIASWRDIVTVYNMDCQLGHTRMNKKLTDQHIHSEKMRKMKVNVAAQVLSAQTSAMLKYTSLFERQRNGENISETMATTAETVEFFDKLFDSVNGSRKNTTKGKLRGPVKANSKHFEFWKNAKHILKNIKFIDASSKKAVSNKTHYLVRVPSLNGWVTSLESFERISKLLFEIYEIEYYYPRNLNQDPLENFFGRIRAINYRNVNPDAYTFSNSFKSLLISNIMGPHSIYSNCEEDNGETVLDFISLFRHFEDEEKENNDPHLQEFSGGCSESQKISPSLTVDDVILEKVRVHSSAYTAGYICRKLTKKINCKNCKNSYLAIGKENIHDWIDAREYKDLKNRNLSYPSKKFLMLYREISEFIHTFMNKFAHIKNVGKNLINAITKKIDCSWLGCSIHNKVLTQFFLKLITRMQIHNWCNIINKILRGALDEKYVKKMKLPQTMALEKYKSCKHKK